MRFNPWKNSIKKKFVRSTTRRNRLSPERDLQAILSRFRGTTGRQADVPTGPPQNNQGADYEMPGRVTRRRRASADNDGSLAWSACLPACLPPRRRRRRRPGAIIRSSLIKLCEMSKDSAMPGKTDNADADYYIPRRPIQHPRLLDDQGNCVYEYIRNFALVVIHIHICTHIRM